MTGWWLLADGSAMKEASAVGIRGGECGLRQSHETAVELVVVVRWWNGPGDEKDNEGDNPLPEENEEGAEEGWKGKRTEGDKSEAGPVVVVEQV